MKTHVFISSYHHIKPTLFFIQTQQQMAALNMGGQPASGFSANQMGTVGGGGGGMGMGGGWGGMQQAGNTMSTNLWQ